MAHINAGRENQSLTFIPEMTMKTPLSAKTMKTPLRTGRKAFGIVNAQLSTPVVDKQGMKMEKLKEGKIMHVVQKKEEDNPEIEKFFPYDPMEFEKCSVPEDFIPLGSLPLAGLAFPDAPPPSEEDQDLYLPLLPSLSPARMPQRLDGCIPFDAFLQTIDELTIELPPEPDTD
ncbi:securin [Syngnathus acus]|uniref:securin n=1 Tax=Syngnathus acus TaxID=161584 RepID=UPI001885F04D|nr:securin [Syngnathus acus]